MSWNIIRLMKRAMIKIQQMLDEILSVEWKVEN